MKIINIIFGIFLFMKLTASIPPAPIQDTVSHDDVPKLTSDLIDSYERPTAVNAYVCWTIRDKAAFTRQFWNSKHQHPIKFINRWTKSREKEAIYFISIVDLSCPNAGEVLKKANGTNLYSSPNRWLLLDAQVNGTDIVPLEIEDMYVPLNSEVLVAQGNVYGRFDIHLIYKLLAKRLWLTEYYGYWSSSSGIKKHKTMIESTPSRRKDLKGESLGVAFNIDEGKSEIRSTKYDMKIKKSKNIVSRWGYEHVVPLFEFLNASRVNVFSDGWGYYVNGSWNGVVGDVARGHADLVGTSLFIALRRMEFLTYIMDTIQTRVLFVFREPPLSYQNNLFLLPYNRAVWISLGVFLLLLLIVIFINAKWEYKKTKILDEKVPEDTARFCKMGMSDVAMMIVGAVTQQGSYVELRGSTGRLVMFAMYLACLFFFTAYSASIVALLQSSSKQIRTLSDLLNSRLELGVENTTYNQYYFTTATEPVRKAIYEQKIKPRENFMSVEDGVKKLQKHPFAFNMDIGLGYKVVERFFLEHEKCGLQEIAYFPRSKPWLTCSKVSPYAELFKIGYFRIREHGMSDRANSLVYAKKPICSVSGGKFDSVSIVDVYPALLMLLYGELLACALLGLEIIVRRRTEGSDDEDSRDTGDTRMEDNSSREIEVVSSPYDNLLNG